MCWQSISRGNIFIFHVVLAIIRSQYVIALEDTSAVRALGIRDKLEKIFSNYTEVMDIVTKKKDQLEKAVNFLLEKSYGLRALEHVSFVREDEPPFFRERNGEEVHNYNKRRRSL